MINSHSDIKNHFRLKKLYLYLKILGNVPLPRRILMIPAFNPQNNYYTISGADPGFSFRGGGGGGAKDCIRERTLRARNPKSLSAGIQGPLKGPGSSRGF